MTDFKLQVEEDVLRIASDGTSNETIKILPQVSAHDISLVPCILGVFKKCLQSKVRNFIIDLSKVPELPPSFVVLLFELTASARRTGGNVTIINLSENAKADLEEFEPLSYLKITMEPPQELPQKQTPLKKAAATFDVPKSQPVSRPVLASDVTLLPERHFYDIEIPSRATELYRACEFVTDLALRAGYFEAEVNKIKIAVYEGCLNAIEHAYHSDPNNKVRVTVEITADQFIIAVIDYGIGFRVDNSLEFDINDVIIKRMSGGMGLMIIKRSMDRVQYKVDEISGNKLIMTKRRAKSSTPAFPSSTN